MKTFGEIILRDGDWRIDAEPHVVLRLKRVFHKLARSQKGEIILSDTPENARELVWFLARYPMKVSPAGHLMKRDTEFRTRATTIEQLLLGNMKPRAFEMALPPREYQKLAAEMLLQSGRLLCADDVGLGKTATAIATLTDPRTRPALVVTLTHLPRQWRAEIKRFLPGLAVHIVKSGQPYDMTKNGRRKDPPPDVIIINYPKLSGWAAALAGKVNSVIFDEIQELRIPKSMKYAGAATITREASFRLGLSATPIYNYGSEIFSVMDMLAPGALGTGKEFREEWCSGDESDRASVKDPRALGTYLREMGLMLRRTRQDVGRELPPITRVPHEIECDLDEIDKVAAGASELARIILSQGGRARGEQMQAAEELSWRLRQATGIAKASYVAEFVRLLVESGEQVVLYGWHREVYSIWAEKLKDFDPAFYTGNESPTQKEKAKQEFVEGRAKVLIMSLRSGAGLDGLQGKTRTVVFGELDWSPGVHEQCIGRVHRDGQPEPVCAYFLIADSGSDPVVADVLGVKRAQAEGLRDPGAPLMAGQTDPDRVRKLAEEFLRQRGERVEPPRTAPPRQMQMRGEA